MNKNTKQNPESIGERIKVLRKSRGMNQQALADFVHISKENISKWENNKLTPSAVMIEAVANYFEVTPYYLMFGRSNHDADNLIDVNGLTFFQIDLVKKLVEELRRGC